jgi:beta-N-acetylhexosaminidase
LVFGVATLAVLAGGAALAASNWSGSDRAGASAASAALATEPEISADGNPVRAVGAVQTEAETPAAPDPAQGAAAVATEAGTPSARDAARTAVERLSIKQLVGQRVIVSYNGREPPEKLFKMIRGGRVAGVIFFGANTGFVPPNFATERSHLRKLIRRMQEARREASPKILRRPLLMMTDQEGGLVRRLGGAPGNSEREIGEAANRRKLAKQAGKGAGENLSSVAMNVNLAPVLGVIDSGDGFLGQFQRSYGFNRREVARLGRLFIQAQQGRGVAATAKHFPGLGAATKNENTDAGPVTLDIPLSRLRTKDELPYKKAIAAGTRLIMLSNALYPALDDKRPASMSPRIIRKELRARLGYAGVTITDALEAGGLSSIGSIRRRGVQGARAGADLLLFSNQELNEGAEGSSALRRALREGRLDRDAFEESALRVLKLRNELRAVPGGKLP